MFIELGHVLVETKATGLQPSQDAKQKQFP